jgi:hypothetical protein
MAKNILSIESAKKDFSCDAQGKGFVSLRGLARLCGVRYQSWGRGDSIFTTAIDRTLAEQGVTKIEVTASGIPDTVAAIVIAHYAQQGKEVAQKTLLAFAAFGLRKAIQETTGFKAIEKRTLSQSEIINLCCLPVPTSWQRRFPEEYYAELSRLTRLKAFGNARPALWAQRTKELVYDYLPSGIYREIKRCKEETGSFDKLHQFLSEDGLHILESHQKTLLILMKASASMQQLKTSLDQTCSGTYQLLLIE